MLLFVLNVILESTWQQLKYVVTVHQEKLVCMERVNVQFVPADIMSATTNRHALHVILESTVIKIYKHQQVHVKNVRKEHTRLPKVRVES